MINEILAVQNTINGNHDQWDITMSHDTFIIIIPCELPILLWVLGRAVEVINGLYPWLYLGISQISWHIIPDNHGCIHRCPKFPLVG